MGHLLLVKTRENSAFKIALKDHLNPSPTKPYFKLENLNHSSITLNTTVVFFAAEPNKTLTVLQNIHLL